MEEELPPSSRWHPLRASAAYRRLAEASAGKAHDASQQYAELRANWRRGQQASDTRTEREGRSTSALDYEWGQTGTAKALVSDLTHHREMAQMYAAMASMKGLQYLADRELGRENSE